jgi:hypothetical protein
VGHPQGNSGVEIDIDLTNPAVTLFDPENINQPAPSALKLQSSFPAT